MFYLALEVSDVATGWVELANRDKWIENHVLDQWLHLSRRAASHSYCYGRAPDVKLQREVVCAAHGRVDIVDGDGNGDS